MMIYINRIIIITFLIFSVSYILAQDIQSVLIQTNSNEAIPFIQNGTVGPISYCHDPELDEILLNFGCTTYVQDFPEARSEAGQRLYRIELSNSSLYKSLIKALEFIPHLNEIFPVMEYYELASCNCDGDIQLNDPMLPNFMVDKINIECAWELSQGDPNITVAAVDNFSAGSDIANDDLLGKLFLVPTAEPNFNNPQPGSCNHGLGIAGAIAAIPDNDFCTAGLGYNTRVAGYNAVRLENENGIITCRRASSHIRNIVRQAYMDGHKIINLSWTGKVLTCTAAQEMVDNGVVIVHADFQSGWNNVGDIPGVIGVGKADWNDNYEPYNTDDNGNPICDTNMDILMSTNAIARPTTDNMCEIAGSKNSIGAGLVSGVIALMMDVNSCLSPAAFEQILEKTHQGVPTNQDALDCGVTAGLIDAYAAVCLAEDYCADPIELNDNICATQDCSNMLLSGDVFVEAGETLTVDGTLSFAECASLIVKRGGRLIIDGGTLTACDNEWKGVVVEGLTEDANNQTGIAGKVELINGATIENARIAVSMNPRHLPWTSQFWGGYIFGDNATIKNCRRGIEFMKHASQETNPNKQDRSTLNNVTFQHIRDTAISIWANDGVDITNCTFIDVGHGANDHEGVIALRSSVTVIGSTFVGCERGVTLETSKNFPNVNPSVIMTNDFSCEEEGIFLQNASTFSRDGNDLSDNIFRSGKTGIWIDGTSSFTISNNDFLNQGEEGIFMQNSGNSENTVIDNDFESNIRALCYNGVNGTSRFETNCFSGSFISDVEVARDTSGVSGRINLVQGDEFLELEAGNVFSKNGIPEVLYDGIDGLADDDIKYLVWQNHAQTAPQRLHNSSIKVIETDIANENPAINCGSSLGLVPPDECELRWYSSEEIISLIAAIDDHLEGNSNGRRDPYYMGLRDQLFGNLALVASDPTNNYSQQDLFNYYKQRTEFVPRTLVPSILMSQGKYNQARQELNLIPTGQDDMAYYKEVQNIYIDFLEQGRDNVSISQLDNLYEIALSPNKAGSYARSLYHRLTEKRIRIPKVYVSNQVNQRSRETNNLKISCFPNPSSVGGVINLRLESEIVEEFSFTISSIEGINVYEGRIQSNSVEGISTETFSAGIYLINVRNKADELIHIQKLSILN